MKRRREGTEGGVRGVQCRAAARRGRGEGRMGLPSILTEKRGRASEEKNGLWASWTGGGREGRHH